MGGEQIYDHTFTNYFKASTISNQQVSQGTNHQTSQMEEVFKSFCAFGAGSKDATAIMDNAKFAKLSRDLKLLDKKLTPTDIDIMFRYTDILFL